MSMRKRSSTMRPTMGGSLRRNRSCSAAGLPGTSTAIDGIVSVGVVPPPSAELPILPVAIDGTYDIYNANARWVKPGPVTIRVGTPIPTEGLTVRDKDRLLNESREQISRMLFGEHPPQ